MLVREFDTLPQNQVLAEVETLTNRLIEQARFDDYIPILVHRYAREHLREHAALVGADAA
jgi:hypothetical protein